MEKHGIEARNGEGTATAAGFENSFTHPPIRPPTFSSTHPPTLLPHIQEDVMEKHGIEARNGGEGTADSGWILLDFGSVVVNVMTPVARKYYALEKLWKKVG